MANTIIFKNENPNLFWQYWEMYIAQHGASPRYTRLNIEWCESISKSRSFFVVDKSFVFVVNAVPVGIIFLPIERQDGCRVGSMVGGYIYAPLCNDLHNSKKIFTIIDEIAQTEKLDKILFATDPLQAAPFNFLQLYNYLDTSILSYGIDLTMDDLVDRCRKSHRQQIREIKNNPDFEIFIVDSLHPARELHDQYVKLHHKCSGRVTRPKDTFDIQYNKLVASEAVLVGVRYREKNIAYSYFEYCNNLATYASGVDDPEYSGFPLYHAMIFTVMEYFKNKGVRVLDVGQPVSPSTQVDYFPTQKHLNISLFKTGFGGSWKNHFRGIKYFSENAAKSDLVKWTEEYLKSIERF